jgi:tetratricopeptide (TPR) repeat protein
MDALRAVQQGRYEQAVTSLRTIVRANPRLFEAWSALAAASEALGRYEDAAAAYRRSIELNPAMGGELALRLAEVLLRLRRFDDAAAHARLGEKDDFGGAHLLLSRVAFEQKRYADAEQEARLAMGDNHNDIQARVVLGRIYAQQDRPREALAVARDAVVEADRRKAGPIESLYFVIGDALARMQDYKGAEQALRREIEVFPRNRQAYASLYLVFMLTERPVDANAALESMVRANPGRATMLFAAQTVEAIGDTRAAVRWRQRAGGAAGS